MISLFTSTADVHTHCFPAYTPSKLAMDVDNQVEVKIYVWIEL